MAGAPKGNTNSCLGNRLWTNSLRRTIAQGEGDMLRKIADKLVDKALAGDIWAIKELGDRLDGKAVRGIEAKHEGGIIVRINK